MDQSGFIQIFQVGKSLCYIATHCILHSASQLSSLFDNLSVPRPSSLIISFFSFVMAVSHDAAPNNFELPGRPIDHAGCLPQQNLLEHKTKSNSSCSGKARVQGCYPAVRSVWATKDRKHFAWRKCQIFLSPARISIICFKKRIRKDFVTVYHLCIHTYIVFVHFYYV